MLGNKLKYLREQDGLSQSQLGKILDVRTSTISNWENDRGEPSYKKLKEIAEYFSVSIDYLLEYEPEFDSEEQARQNKEIIEKTIKLLSNKKITNDDLDKALEIIEVLKKREEKK